MSIDINKCWDWTGTVRKQDSRPMAGNIYAYRLVWEAATGSISVGMSIHHKCENELCVNPWHLEALTQGDHIKKHGLCGDWGQKDKTHCPRGHAYDDANTYYYRRKGGIVERHCKICKKINKIEWRKRQKAKGLKVT